ncbi:MAG: GNAT family N-acetyltransferase [Singulisphaera sp.]
MAEVMHFLKRLQTRPTVGAAAAFSLRSFAGPTDIPLWLELRNRAFARAKPGILAWNESDMARELFDRPWWSPDRVWFALAHEPGSDQPVALGTVALAARATAEGEAGAVHWLAVLPAWRRRGVARLLMQALEERAWNLGYREIYLETHAGWTGAQRLYEALQYSRIT